MQNSSKYLRYASNSLKISSMIRVMFHVVVLFPSFRIWKWWRYPLRQRPRALTNPKQNGVPEFMKYGYIPADKKRDGVGDKPLRHDKGAFP